MIRKINFALQMKSTGIILAMCLFFACNEPAKQTSVGPKEFNQAISTSNVQVLDVRTPEEFESGHIRNAVNVDVQSADFEEKAEGLYKDVPVYVYCRSGKRSATAADKLKSMGFKEVYNLEGGIEQWQKDGLPVAVVQPKPEPVDFGTAIKGDKLVLVDFNAEWCRPCKMMEPFVLRMQRERQDVVTVLSVDVDKQPDIASEYSITQMPTIMLFRNGKVLDKSIGYMDEAKLNAFVDKYL